VSDSLRVRRSREITPVEAEEIEHHVADSDSRASCKRRRSLATPPLADQTCLSGCNETRDGAERLERSLRKYERTYRVAAVDLRLSVRAR
jgi:hypothetical protein